MKLQQDLLGAWAARSALSDAVKLSTPARERIAALLLESATVAGDSAGQEGNVADTDKRSTEMAELAIGDGLSASCFCAELCNCQLSLLNVLLSEATDASAQPLSVRHDELSITLIPLMARLDGLIAQSSVTFARLSDASVIATTPHHTAEKKGKTLQHEIRTPLQGALLTTELMLEDAGHGDPVSADDILAVRKSIETAVGILNDFASRSILD